MKINNPLTVIAVFSLLTEASAAVSLPYIDSEHQKAYVWFLIIFPSLLITLFFLTLNFNNKTLYTPADLSKAENTHEGTACPPQTAPKTNPPACKPKTIRTVSYTPQPFRDPIQPIQPAQLLLSPPESQNLRLRSTSVLRP